MSSGSDSKQSTRIPAATRSRYFRRRRMSGGVLTGRLQFAAAQLTQPHNNHSGVTDDVVKTCPCITKRLPANPGRRRQGESFSTRTQLDALFTMPGVLVRHWIRGHKKKNCDTCWHAQYIVLSLSAFKVTVISSCALPLLPHGTVAG